MKIQTLVIAITSALLLSACGGGKSTKLAPPVKVNTPPTAQNASVSTQAESELIGQLMANDADQDRLTFSLVTQPSQGSVTLASDGSFSYLPNPEVTGADQFSFRVSDGKANSAVATVNISIALLAVNMSSYTRQAFNQMENDKPLPLNSRLITQDVNDPNGFNDLLGN